MRRALVLALGAVWCVVVPARAQNGDSTPSTRNAPQRIDSIVVLNEDIFGRAEEMGETGFLARTANALHIRTTAGTIRRTLLFEKGDVFDSALVVESARALRNLGVFRQVGMDTARIDDRLFVIVSTADGWSTRPQFTFATVGGDQTWSVGLAEENFLGRASEISAAYRHTPDRNAFDLGYRSPHFIFPRWVALFRYSDFSDGGAQGTWRLGLPFAQTAARVSLETSGTVGRTRMLLFRDGEKDTTRLRQLGCPVGFDPFNPPDPDQCLLQDLLRVTIRGGIALRANNRNYTRAWATLMFRREDYTPDTAGKASYSAFGVAGAGLEFGHTRFKVVRHYNSFNRREDLNLSQILRVGAWFAPQAWGYEAGRAGVAPEVIVQGSTVWSGGHIIARVGASGVFGSAGLDSGRVGGSLSFGSQNLPGQTIILHTEAAAARNLAPGAEYDFWYDRRSGPRLFGAHAFTGTRLVWVTFEDRILVAEELYGMLGVGIAPFFDWGGIWFDDQKPRTGWNVGFSWRFGPTRATRGNPIELAIGVRYGAGIQSGQHWAMTLRRSISF